jgi:transposase
LRQALDDVVKNGVLDVLSTSCQWRALPNDLPPRSTSGSLVSWRAYPITRNAQQPRCRKNPDPAN